MNIPLLVKLTARAWCLDILSALHAGVAGRQAPLVAATGAGRTAFGHSMAHLLEMQVVERNPGHGHPLRPEFRLTALGVPLARVAHAVVTQAPGQAEVALLRRRWTVPVLAVVGTPRRFSQVKVDLGRITDRALAQTVGQLQHQGWVARHVDVTATPPHPLYVAANTGAVINHRIVALGGTPG